MLSRFCPWVSSRNSLVWSLTFTFLMCFWWTWCAAWESGLRFYIWISSLLSVAHWGISPKSPSVLSISLKTTDSGRTVYLWDLPLVSLSCTPLLQLWSFSRYVGLFFSLFGAGMRDRNCTESADCLCQNEHINIKRFNLFLYFKFSFLRVSQSWTSVLSPEIN